MTYEYVLDETDEDAVDDVHSDILTVTTEVRLLICDAILAELVGLRNIKLHIVCQIRFIKAPSTVTKLK